MVTPATLADITSQLNSMSQNIINLANSSAAQEKGIVDLKQKLSDEETARKTSDTSLFAQISAATEAVGKLKASVGVVGGIAPLGDDGLVPEDNLPDMRTKIGRCLLYTSRCV